MKLKRATYINMIVCDDPMCRSVHLVLYSRTKAPIAEGGVHVDDVATLIDDIRRCAAEVSTKGMVQ